MRSQIIKIHDMKNRLKMMFICILFLDLKVTYFSSISFAIEVRKRGKL